VIIVLSAVPIAILTNASRVSGTGILSHYYGTTVADGFFHSFSGWAIYIVAFLLLFLVGWIVDRFRPRPPAPPATADVAAALDENSTREHATVSSTNVLPAEGTE
jgi:hypothetical protein